MIPLVFAIADTPDAIDKTAGLIRRAEVYELAKTFTPTIELTILDSENDYSIQQAEQALNKFFKQNQPRSVRILHRISSNTNYRFGVVILNTDNGVYRVAFSLKKVDGRFLLNELRIETEKTK